MQTTLLITPVISWISSCTIKEKFSAKFPRIITSPHFRFSFSLFNKYWYYDLAMKIWEVISSNFSHNMTAQLLNELIKCKCARDQFSSVTGGLLLESDFNIINSLHEFPFNNFFHCIDTWAELTVMYHALF